MMAKGKVTSFETILYSKTKEPIWTLVSTSPVHDENGEIIRHILICLDITERKRSEDQLQLLLDHSQKLNKQLELRDQELQSSIRKLSKQSWEIQISKQHLQKNRMSS
ncbi:MAG: PAS domain-containing protein [Bacteroidetes bacterium]|nr:PAS domain-containing protein [Bacteroidota bacterium]